MPLSPYVRFTVSKEKLWKGMPSRERRVLKAVLIHGPVNLLTVSGLISLSSLGSPLTIHICLKRLIESGHLKYSTNPIYGVCKFISLTTTSNILFRKLNTLMLKSILIV